MNEKENAVHEVMQEIALAGLARGGFFSKAAFYGGTCLHLFHGLERFSEDMDFSLLAPDPLFAFENYFEAVKDEFRLAGKESGPDVDLSTPEAVVAAFDARIDTIDFNSAREDVEPFIENISELQIWSRDFRPCLFRLALTCGFCYTIAAVPFVCFCSYAAF